MSVALVVLQKSVYISLSVHALHRAHLSAAFLRPQNARRLQDERKWTGAALSRRRANKMDAHTRHAHASKQIPTQRHMLCWCCVLEKARSNDVRLWLRSALMST